MKIKLLLIALIISAPLMAEIVYYSFDDPAKEERFNELIEDLRCPKCQNNNLEDSNAPLSLDLKNIVHDMLHKGASDKEIINFLKDRYGDFIYYKPPLNRQTWFIWFGPFLLLFAAGFVIIRFLNSKRNDALAGEHAHHMKTIDEWHKESGDSD